MKLDRIAEPIPNTGRVRYAHFTCQYCGATVDAYGIAGMRRKGLRGFAMVDGCSHCGRSTADIKTARRRTAC